MKSILSLIVLAISLNMNAQETIIPLNDRWKMDNPLNNVYYKDTNNVFDKFTGNWIFDDGNNYLKITITKIEHELIGGGQFTLTKYEDLLKIHFIFKQNGIEKYNTYSSINHPVLGSTISSSIEIELFYDEPTLSCRRQKDANLKLKFISDGTLTETGSLPNGTLQWSRLNTFHEGLTPLHTCPDGTLVDSSEYLIPANLTLERE